jgi:uncharacterized protein (TIGR03000 family)
MYSVVMMVAMTSAPDAVACGRRGGGCHGCNGGCYGGCHGSYYGGCRGGGYAYGYGSGGPAYAHGDWYSPGYAYQPDYMAPGNGYTSNYADLSSPTDRATIAISLPPDAKLFFDSQPTMVQGNMRRFVTPALDPNSIYSYMLTATVNRNGAEQKVEKKITVRPGQVTQVSLEPEFNRDSERQAPVRGENVPAPRKGDRDRNQ